MPSKRTPTHDPRDLANLLPPDLVAAVEEAESILCTRIRLNRDLPHVETLHPDVPAPATRAHRRR